MRPTRFVIKVNNNLIKAAKSIKRWRQRTKETTATTTSATTTTTITAATTARAERPRRQTAGDGEDGDGDGDADGDLDSLLPSSTPSRAHERPLCVSQCGLLNVARMRMRTVCPSTLPPSPSPSLATPATCPRLCVWCERRPLRIDLRERKSFGQLISEPAPTGKTFRTGGTDIRTHTSTHTHTSVVSMAAALQKVQQGDAACGPQRL